MSGSDRRSSGAIARIVILLGATILLGIGVTELWPWISDDAFISLRYAERLWNGQGLTWNDGERVEGYSNLLWILLTCALRPLGLDPVAIVRVLGILATVATLAVVVQTPWLRRHGATPSVAILALAALAPTALWSIGGLETPLALLLTTAGFAATGTVLAERDDRPGTRAAWVAGICFALLAWTRPDGPLAGVMAGAAITVFARQWLWRRLLAIVGPVALAVLLQLIFRLVYYGDYVPNTAHVKVGSSAATLAQGLDYLGSAATILRSLLVPAALGAVIGLLDRRSRPFALLSLAFVAAWTTYTAVIGGDLFPFCRILLPLLGPLTLLAALGFALLASSRPGTFAAWGLALLAALGARLDSAPDPNDRYQQVSDWEWHGKPVGEWLAKAFGDERPLLALDAAGGVPFYSGLPCLDMLGLNDRHIATAPPPDPDHVVPGHSRGDGGYVLDREPDLVLFASPTGDPSPRWPGAWQMESDPRFLRDYRCVVCRTGPVEITGQGEQDLKLTLWVRLAGRVGLRAEGGGYVLPGFLLGAHRQPMPFHRREPNPPPLEGPAGQQRALAALAMLEWWNDEACIGVLTGRGDEYAAAGELGRAGSTVLAGLPLPPGDWEVSAEPAGLPIDFELLPRSDGFDLRATVQSGAALPLRVDSIRITPR